MHKREAGAELSSILIQIWALPLPGCVAMGKLLNFSRPQFLHL